jgi:hypothetical protein
LRSASCLPPLHALCVAKHLTTCARRAQDDLTDGLTADELTEIRKVAEDESIRIAKAQEEQSIREGKASLPK